MSKCNRTTDFSLSEIQSMNRKRPAQSGVTLIELMVVVTIIALFAALVGPALFKNVGKGRVTAAKSQIESFMTALGAYKLDTGTYPSTEMGLQALRVKPESVGQWAGPYLPQDIPMDPWGHPYLYKYPGDHGAFFKKGLSRGERSGTFCWQWKVHV